MSRSNGSAGLGPPESQIQHYFIDGMRMKKKKTKRIMNLRGSGVVSSIFFKHFVKKQH